MCFVVVVLCLSASVSLFNSLSLSVPLSDGSFVQLSVSHVRFFF